ncbi:MAG: Maf family protein [Gammaproteobacteria bacterium]|jgi:septum formation protein
MRTLVLASASPRRRELLSQIGVRFRRKVVPVDETPRDGEPADRYVQRLALEKARAVRRTLDPEAVLVMGADTEVVCGGRPLGKPADLQHARDMLRRLSGRHHQVLSAVALVGDYEAVRLSESSVWLRPLSDAEIDAYWQSGEPGDKAGGYAIQGLGAVFVQRLEGSYSGVMGLPLYETAQLLKEFGIQVLGRQS